MKEKESIQIMKECPHFDSCSAPICPLDLLQEIRDKGDGEEKCILSKSKRLKIASGTKLPLQGMTKTEWASHQRWSQLSESEKEDRIAKLRGF